MPCDRVRHFFYGKFGIVEPTTKKEELFLKADVEFMATGEFLTAALTGEIDHHTAALLRSKIDEQIDRRLPQKLILDFSGVCFMDSSGIGLILGRSKRMQAAGGQVMVRGVSPQINRMLRLANIQAEQ